MSSDDWNNGLSEEEALQLALNLSQSDSSSICKVEIDPRLKGHEGMKSIVLQEYKTPNGRLLQICKGDMTTEVVDVVVNAANSKLHHQDGLAGLLVRKGGYIIQKESDAHIKAHGILNEGEIAVTSAGSLEGIKFIFHAVGPYWRRGKNNEKILLEKAVNCCLQEADIRNLQSISIPALSSGIFGFPKDLCAKILIDSSKKYLQKHDNDSKSTLKEIRLVNFDDYTCSVFEEVFLTDLGHSQKKFGMIVNSNRKTSSSSTTSTSSSVLEDRYVFVEQTKPINSKGPSSGEGSDLNMIRDSTISLEDKELQMVLELSKITAEAEKLEKQKYGQEQKSSKNTATKSGLSREIVIGDGNVLQLRIGDICMEECDCIVNAANEKLQHDAGVAKAISTYGGPIIQEQCNQFILNNGPLKVSEVFTSIAGNIKAKYIHHTVAPIFDGNFEFDGMENGGVKKMLMETVNNCLEESVKLKLKSVAFPALGTGKFGIPVELCAMVLISSSLLFFLHSDVSFLNAGKFQSSSSSSLSSSIGVDCGDANIGILDNNNAVSNSVKEIRIVVFDEETLKVFEKVLDSFIDSQNANKNIENEAITMLSLNKH